MFGMHFLIFATCEPLKAWQSKVQWQEKPGNIKTKLKQENRLKPANLINAGKFKKPTKLDNTDQVAQSEMTSDVDKNGVEHKRSGNE